MTKQFPSDFYVTCASVIPVLFLAVAVQGTYLASFMRTSRLTVISIPASLVPPRMNRHPHLITTGVVSFQVFLRYLALGTVGAAGVGEFFALLALYRGSVQGSWQPALVFAAKVALMFVVVAAALVSLALAGGRSPVLREGAAETGGYQRGQAPEGTGDHDS